MLAHDPQGPSDSETKAGSMSMVPGFCALGARYCGLEAMSTRACIWADSHSIFIVLPRSKERVMPVEEGEVPGEPVYNPDYNVASCSGRVLSLV